MSADAEGDGSAHLLSGSTLAWALARAAHTLAPTQDLTDLDPNHGYQPDAGVGQALDAAVDELQWWAETLHEARRDRPFA